MTVVNTIEPETRVLAQGRYLGVVEHRVEVYRGEHRTWAYRIRYRCGLDFLRGWFLARDVEATRTFQKEVTW